MKTEVVLKSEGFESETETVAFNENRSCIEICYMDMLKEKGLRLMKTEVVLKY